MIAFGITCFMNSLCYVTPISVSNFLRCFCNIVTDCAMTCNCDDCSKLSASNDQMNNHYFFSIRVFFTDTDNSFIPLYHFHPLTNTETSI